MFSMCSELTPRAHVPDNRIPQLMQPCTRLTKIFIAIFAPDERLPSSATLAETLSYALEGFEGGGICVACWIRDKDENI